MNDIEEMNKQMDEELKKSPALKMAFTQIRALDNKVKELEKYKHGYCPKCGSLMGYVKGHEIIACTGNCGNWINAVR